MFKKLLIATELKHPPTSPPILSHFSIVIKMDYQFFSYFPDTHRDQDNSYQVFISHFSSSKFCKHVLSFVGFKILILNVQIFIPINLVILLIKTGDVHQYIIPSEPRFKFIKEMFRIYIFFPRYSNPGPISNLKCDTGQWVYFFAHCVQLNFEP